jgi:hypothetical protein
MPCLIHKLDYILLWNNVRRELAYFSHLNFYPISLRKKAGVVFKTLKLQVFSA